MKYLFAPGCGQLLLWGRQLPRLEALLQAHLGEVERFDICCRALPKLPENCVILTLCAGCDKVYRTHPQRPRIRSVWELLDSWEDLPLPQYTGRSITVLDHCAVPPDSGIPQAVRSLLTKMGFQVVEPDEVPCCGGTSCRTLPEEEFARLVQEKIRSLPGEEVCTYGSFCTHGVYLGGKQPRYLLDLLFESDTPCRPAGYDKLLAAKMATR